MIHKVPQGQDVRTIGPKINELVDAANAFLNMSGGGIVDVQHTAGGCIVSAAGPGQIISDATGTGTGTSATAKAHPLLNGNIHSDTVAHTPPVAGDIVYGTSANPSKWNGLAIASSASILHVHAGLPAWFGKGVANQVLSMDSGGVDLAWYTPGAAEPTWTIGGEWWIDSGTSGSTAPTYITLSSLDWRGRVITANFAHYDGTAAAGAGNVTWGSAHSDDDATLVVGAGRTSEVTLLSDIQGTTTIYIVVDGTDGGKLKAKRIAAGAIRTWQMRVAVRATAQKSAADYTFS